MTEDLPRVELNLVEPYPRRITYSLIKMGWTNKRCTVWAWQPGITWHVSLKLYKFTIYIRKYDCTDPTFSLFYPNDPISREYGGGPYITWLVCTHWLVHYSLIYIYSHHYVLAFSRTTQPIWYFVGENDKLNCWTASDECSAMWTLRLIRKPDYTFSLD